MKQRCYLSALGIVNALGCGGNAISPKLFAGDTSGMVLEHGLLPASPARVGRVSSALLAIPSDMASFSCRNNQLLLSALKQIENEIEFAMRRYGRARVGIILGTSTSGIAEAESAIAVKRRTGEMPSTYRYTQQEIGMTSTFLARYLNLLGPAYTISTACTSSAKAFQSARNLLRHNLCDAVIVGGADSLCQLTVNGFSSLESTTSNLTNPMSRNRNGINIGEGAALFLMTREESEIELLGVGESSDAYHMSAPHPEGLGAEMAMRAAMNDATLKPDDIDYLNLHATATPKNDEMESRAVSRLFGDRTLVSGTKPLTGHTLGAAGATELAFCWLALQQGRIPPHIWDGEPDPDLPRLNLAGQGLPFAKTTGRVCMSNSFAFGGSNASLVIGDAR
ncbi:MAG: beta-ketoacyl-[acyl-carrier-protein] synthase family protein [Oxalobacter sp.]|nr:MAG: beta-ketoacyl-[acyl-carrier-protein] synthase family protein [Oxalobacter sp.]